MGTYGLEGVMRAWELEQLTPEQAIGQMLQLIAGLEERIRDLEHKYSRLNRIVSSPTLQLPEDEVEEE
ncbi:MAG: hypothetical protein PVF45_01070 [Anaerolineae bacterium]|jgi:hypothetical protein